MPNTLLFRERFQQLLLANWTSLIDASTVMRRALVDARDAELKVVREKDAPLPRTRITITKFELEINNRFEIWAEFTIPQERGVAVGTHIYSLNLDGELELKNTLGVLLVPEVRQSPDA